MELRGHEARVTDVAEIGDHVLASVSHDMTLRFWDLHTRHEMHCVHRAHDCPIHSVEHADVREEVATAAVDPTVKIWHAFKPFSLKAVLSGHTGDVTAVKWCEWRMLWITAADDHTIRLWDPDMGETIRCLSIRGEAVTTMMLDPVNQCLVAAMLDRKIRLFDVAQLEGLKDRFGQWVGEGAVGEEGEEGGGEGGGGGKGEGEGEGGVADAGAGDEPMDEIQAELSGAPSCMSSPRSAKNFFGGATVDDIAVPLIIYSGHTDLVRSIVYVAGKRQYFSAGWDKTIRVWFAPNHGPKRQGSAATLTATAAQTTLMADDSEEFVSSYERMHPLVPPASLRNALGAHTLKLTRGKKGEKTEEDMKRAEAAAGKAREMKTSLGRRLNELEAKLDLQAKAKGGAGGDKEGRRRSINNRTTRSSYGVR